MYWIKLVKKDEEYREEAIVSMRVMSRDVTMMREELTKIANLIDKYADQYETGVPNVGPVS